MLSLVLSDTFSSVGHVFPVKTKNNMERQQVTDNVVFLHCIQLFSEVEIVYPCILKQTNIMLCGFTDHKK